MKVILDYRGYKIARENKDILVLDMNDLVIKRIEDCRNNHGSITDAKIKIDKILKSK